MVDAVVVVVVTTILTIMVTTGIAPHVISATLLKGMSAWSAEPLKVEDQEEDMVVMTDVEVDLNEEKAIGIVRNVVLLVTLPVEIPVTSVMLLNRAALQFKC